MKICVYCASEERIAADYLQQGEQFGRMLAQRGHTLVYGGYNRGIMGAIARGAAEGGAEIVAVVPEFFHRSDEELQYSTDLRMVDSMGVRKEVMQAESDAFVIFPGGIGTLDELFDTMAQKAVGKLDKPILLYNQNGCYDGLLAFLQQMMRENLIPAEKQQLMQVVTNVDAIFAVLEQA